MATKKNVKAKSNYVPFEIGKKYLIRTVTHYHCGTMSRQCGGFLVLENAAWIADTGRFSNALASGKFEEVEPFAKPVIVNLASIIDATEVDNPAISQQK